MPGQASTGNARGCDPRARIRPPSWWERNRREGPRTPSQGRASDRHRVQPRAGGTHPNAIPGAACGRHPVRQVVTALRCGAAQPAHAARRRSGDRDRGHFPWYHGVKTIPVYRGGAADAPGVGRARANHGMSGQRMIQPRDCCSPTANAYDRASARHHGQRIPCLDRSSPGTPANAITGHASGRHRGGNGIAGNALGRHPRERHPTVIASISAGNDCPRRSSWGTPADANMAGGSARPSGVVPPNPRISLPRDI